MERGAQLGNNNAGKGKPITDALILALQREAKDSNGVMTRRLMLMCDKVAKEAADGVQWAVQYVTDRIEGKAAQAIEHSGQVDYVEIDAVAVLKQRIEGMASRMQSGSDTDVSDNESIH